MKIKSIIFAPINAIKWIGRQLSKLQSRIYELALKIFGKSKKDSQKIDLKEKSVSQIPKSHYPKPFPADNPIISKQPETQEDLTNKGTESLPAEDELVTDSSTGVSLDDPRKKALEGLIKNPSSVRWLDKSLRSDKEFMKETVKGNSEILKEISESDSDFTTLLCEAVKYDPSAIKHAGFRFTEMRKVPFNNKLIAAIQTNLEVIDHLERKGSGYDDYGIMILMGKVPESIKKFEFQNKDDPDFIRSKIIQMMSSPSVYLKNMNDPCDILRYVSKDLLQDGSYMLDLIEIEPKASKYADKKLLSNKDFVIKAGSNSKEVWQYCDEQLWKDKNFILDALKVNRDPLDLYFSGEINVSELIRKEHDKKNIETAGIILSKVDVALRRDKDIALAAIKNSSEAILYLPEDMQIDMNFLKEAVRENPGILLHAREDIRDNEDFILEIVELNGFALKFASDRLRDKEKIVLAAVNNNGYALKFASERLRKKERIVLAAVNKNGGALQYAHLELRKNEKIALDAIKEKYEGAIYYVDESLRNNKEFMIKVAREYPECMTHLCNNIAKEQVSSEDEDLAKQEPHPFMKDKDVALVALEALKHKNSTHTYLYHSFHEDLRKDPDIQAYEPQLK